MARLPRFELAGVPQHVVQRGNNRLPCFLDDEDRQRYLQCLRQALLRFGCKLHAYVLMSNHVHLLLTPVEAGAVSRMMHTFARNYVGSFNGRHGRTGTLWEGRYKACLVDSGRYFLACSRYIELNPVRAWMVAQPNEYPWSSYGANAEGRTDSLLTPHPEYLALDSDPVSRISAYRALFAELLPDELVDEIRIHLAQQKVLGTDRFRSWVEARTGRFAIVRPVGRPPGRSNCP
ncbi:MAG: transposase [Rhodanobacter sp.]